MSQPNKIPNNILMVEYVVGRFMPTQQTWKFLCKKTIPRGAYVFVDGIHVEKEYWPIQNQYYVVAISQNTRTRSGNSRKGRIVASIEVIRVKLIEILKTAAWEKDRNGHCQIKGRYINTLYGKFEPIYDNGQRSDGDDKAPSIRFIPIDGLSYGQVLHQCGEHLCCRDDDELERARRAGG